MARCNEIRPWLYRTAEGEGTPAETLAVAEHVPQCTACRILLAREHRLAEMLEEDLEDLAVDASFVESVMDRLPDGPPPPRRRRGLKLAGVGGLLALALTQVATRVPLPPGTITHPSLPAVSPETVAEAMKMVGGVVKFVLAALSSVAAVLPDRLPEFATGPELIALLALGAAGALLGGAAVLAVTAGALLRTVR